MIKILLARINSYFRKLFNKDTIIWFYTVNAPLPEEIKYSDEEVLFEGTDYYYFKGFVYLKEPKIWLKYNLYLATLRGEYIPVQIKNGKIDKI